MKLNGRDPIANRNDFWFYGKLHAMHIRSLAIMHNGYMQKKDAFTLPSIASRLTIFGVRRPCWVCGHLHKFYLVRSGTKWNAK